MSGQQVAPGQVWRYIGGNRRVRVLSLPSATRAIVLGLASARTFPIEVDTLRRNYGLESRLS